MLHLCLCFALRESTWSSSPKILFLDLRWTLGAIFGQIVASLNAHITLDYARKHFSWHVQPLCTWYMRPKHYGRLGNNFDHTNILIYYNKHITNLQWISHIFRPMKYPFITSQWLAILKPSWKQYSFLFGPTKFCHYPYVDVYGVYLQCHTPNMYLSLVFTWMVVPLSLSYIKLMQWGLLDQIKLGCQFFWQRQGAWDWRMHASRKICALAWIHNELVLLLST